MLNLRLSEMRKKKGVTQDEISKYLKITNKTYSTYETGRNQISNETLCLLADYFDVSIDYLLGRQDKMPSFLSEREQNIIEDFRVIDERGKKNVETVLASERSNILQPEQTKKSVG